MPPARRPALALSVAVAAVALVGCGTTPPPTAAPTAEQPKLRSALFTALEAEPKANKLRDRFAAKFPAYTFQVIGAERVSAAGSVETKVTLVVKNPGPKFDDETDPLFDELQAYLEEQVAATGMELNGPVEQLGIAKKSGFTLKYRSATHKGRVYVQRLGYVPGGFGMQLSEME